MADSGDRHTRGKAPSSGSHPSCRSQMTPCGMTQRHHSPRPVGADREGFLPPPGDRSRAWRAGLVPLVLRGVRVACGRDSILVSNHPIGTVNHHFSAFRPDVLFGRLLGRSLRPVVGHGLLAPWLCHVPTLATPAGDHVSAFGLWQHNLLSVQLLTSGPWQDAMRPCAPPG
jgi:hypothetical protein